ncbi:hypothetical protein C2E23DRAFT_73955 [Lenzites betulinus]|nr:hypothetical protein C2E23DRAFT_73955 [Lenzites betulinus]
MTATNQYSDDSLKDMRTLFRAVAGDLYTLSINLTLYFSAVPPSLSIPPLGVLTHPLTSLHELTVLGVPNPNMIISAPDFLKQPIFPALRCLHMVNSKYATLGVMVPPFTNLDKWMAHAPLASHLRVSNLNWLCHHFLEQLAGSMGYREAENRSTLVPRLLRPRQTMGHPHLKNFAVQLCPAPLGHPGSTRDSIYSNLSQKLQNILAFPKEPGLRMVLVPSAPAGSALDLAEFAMGQWLDRIEGGLGCWDVFEDEDLRPSAS